MNDRELFRVHPDDPEYRRTAAAEVAFWERTQPFSLERREDAWTEGPVDRHINARFTGDPDVHWYDTIARHGDFRRGLVLGTSQLGVERCILEANPRLHLTFVDLSDAAVERRHRVLGPRFPGRVAGRVADLNFLTLEPEEWDLVVSEGVLHHVINLEHLSEQIRRGLTRDGRFFVQDYVGEPRCDFTAGKRRLFEILYQRELSRQTGRRPGVRWKETGDLSPFCGVRADAVLPALRGALREIDCRTASALGVALLRAEPADGITAPHGITWQRALSVIRKLVGRRPMPADAMLNPEWIAELCEIGDLAADAGLVPPGLAFAVYARE
jgi:SAM-dependent methyltransferase